MFMVSLNLLMKNKSEGKSFGIILKLDIKRGIKLIFSDVTYLHAYVLKTSLSLPSFSPKEKGFVSIIYGVTH